MNTKTYKVLKTILEHPNEWQGVLRLASDIDMTRRQVTAAVCAYKHLPLQVDRSSSSQPSCCDTYVMYQGTKEDADRVLAQITEEYYGISDEMKEKIYNTLSSAAWMSITDIVDDTSMNKSDVAHALGLMDGVITKTSGVLVLYRRGTEVS